MSTPQISVSQRAEAHIKTQVEQTQSRYLRLGVKESGCNGFMYTLDFLDDVSGDDQQIAIADGVVLCIRDCDLPMVRGTQIDMVTQGLNSAMVFKNPNAQSYCGCGESFALGEAASDGINSSATGGHDGLSDLAVDATQVN